ncbi:TetR/AcrR family transcriptional regulator [Streptomyces sp. NPDC001591]|uniref:TetR/AcrR family transcriptional regulator n=1 Tax=Streptomyces sp. NPDC001591 TaxID=3364589 RepID=UPI0036B275C3
MTEETSPLRERLIDVGTELVLTEGSAAVGLREIARRAGVSHGAPRRYFPTHQALLSAIARRGFEDLAARFEAAVADPVSARGQLEAVSRAYIRYALERRGMFELMFRHDLLDSASQAPGGPRLRESTLPLLRYAAELVVRCRGERSAGGPGPAEPPPAVTAAALWSNLHGLAQLWAWGSLPLALGAQGLGDASDEEQRDRLIAAVLDAHLGPVPS